MTHAVSAVYGRLGAAIVHTLPALAPNQPIIWLARTPEEVQIDELEVRPGEYTDRTAMTASLTGVQTLMLISLNTPPDTRAAQHSIAIQVGVDAGIRQGACNASSDFETAAGRPHLSWVDYFDGLRRH